MYLAWISVRRFKLLQRLGARFHSIRQRAQQLRQLRLDKTSAQSILASRDGREWLFAFPLPPIPVQSIPIPSHSHSQFCHQFPLPWESHGIPMSIGNPIPMVISTCQWRRGPSDWVSEQGLASRSTHYRSFRSRSSRQSLVLVWKTKN